MLLEFVLFISLILFAHTYIIYPISVYVLSKLFAKRYAVSSDELTLSIIISAFNEEKVIEDTVRNFLNSDYDNENIEILIGSDKSDDHTGEIIGNLSKEFSNISFFDFKIRRGKGHVLNDLVKEAKNEILIFSDANTIYDKSALRNLVKYYKDNRVGGVSGKLILNDIDKSIKSGTQEKTYWVLETYLKELEGSLGILIGANGGIYSIRREFYTQIPADYPVMDDFYISLKVLEQKKDMLYVKEAFAEEDVAPSISSEFKRKIRNNSIDLSSIRGIKKLLSPVRGLVAYALWSHKIVRWFSPLLLLSLFISNLFLIDAGELYFYLFVLQTGFYVFFIHGIYIE